MKVKLYLAFAVAVCLSIQIAIAQIDIVPVADPISDRYFKTVVYNSKLYVSESETSFLRAYSGAAVTNYTYPVVSGNQLTVHDHQYLKDPSTVYNNKLYTVLSNYAIGQFLYSFNGSIFTHIPLPHSPVSNPVVYNGQLHVLAKTPTGLGLLRYDGTTVSVALPITANVFDAEYELFIAGDYLYILFTVDIPGDGTYARVVRYDGSSSITLPDLVQWEIQDIVGMPGTENALIIGNGFMLYHFDGTTLDTISSDYGYQTISAQAWQGAFYFERSYEPILPASVYKYKDGVLTHIALPDGAQAMYGAKLTVYNNNLYIPAVADDGTTTIYKYDGASASLFYYFAGLISSLWQETWLGVRNGNLLIVPYTDQHDYAFEYNGSTITLLQTTGGEHISRYITTIGCNHIWELNYRVGITDRFLIANEDAVSCGMPIIPTILWEYEHFRLSTFTSNRKWSWAGMDLDFAIDTLCAFPPLCPDPEIQVSLYDKPGNQAWQKTFDAPFSEKFPVADKPYALFTGIDNYNAGFQNIVSLDASLVPRGVEEVFIDIKPDQRYLNLNVKTKHNKKVSFAISLLNAKGKTIWKENLVAPINKQLTGIVREPGASFRIEPASRSCKHFLVSSIRYYPNPVRGKLNIDIDQEDESTERLSTPVQIVITDFKGYKIVSEHYEDAGTKQLDLTAHKPGLYIMTITVGDEIRKELIQVK